MTLTGQFVPFSELIALQLFSFALNWALRHFTVTQPYSLYHLLHLCGFLLELTDRLISVLSPKFAIESGHFLSLVIMHLCYFVPVALHVELDSVFVVCWDSILFDCSV